MGDVNDIKDQIITLLHDSEVKENSKRYTQLLNLLIYVYKGIKDNTVKNSIKKYLKSTDDDPVFPTTIPVSKKKELLQLFKTHQVLLHCLDFYELHGFIHQGLITKSNAKLYKLFISTALPSSTDVYNIRLDVYTNLRTLQHEVTNSDKVQWLNVIVKTILILQEHHTHFTNLEANNISCIRVFFKYCDLLFLKSKHLEKFSDLYSSIKGSYLNESVVPRVVKKQEGGSPLQLVPIEILKSSLARQNKDGKAQLRSLLDNSAVATAINLKTEFKHIFTNSEIIYFQPPGGDEVTEAAAEEEANATAPAAEEEANATAPAAEEANATAPAAEEANATAPAAEEANATAAAPAAEPTAPAANGSPAAPAPTAGTAAAPAEPAAAAEEANATAPAATTAGTAAANVSPTEKSTQTGGAPGEQVYKTIFIDGIRNAFKKEFALNVITRSDLFGLYELMDDKVFKVFMETHEKIMAGLLETEPIRSNVNDGILHGTGMEQSAFLQPVVPGVKVIPGIKVEPGVQVQWDSPPVTSLSTLPPVHHSTLPQVPLSVYKVSEAQRAPRCDCPTFSPLTMINKSDTVPKVLQYEMKTGIIDDFLYRCRAFVEHTSTHVNSLITEFEIDIALFEKKADGIIAEDKVEQVKARKELIASLQDDANKVYEKEYDERKKSGEKLEELKRPQIDVDDLDKPQIDGLTLIGSRKMNNLVTHTARKYKQMLFKYFKHHFNFIRKEFGRDTKYILGWKAIIQQRREHYRQYKNQDSGSKDVGFDTYYSRELDVIEKQVEPFIKIIINLVEQFYHSRSNYTTQLPLGGSVNINFNQLALLDNRFNKTMIVARSNVIQLPSIISNIENWKTELEEYNEKLHDKLYSMYNRNQSLMDFVMDSRVMVLYILKIVHFFLFLVAMFLTEKIFSELYMKKLYAENKEPPSILIMLAILIAVDVGFILFMLTILFLLKYIFERPADNFIINMPLIMLFLKDYVLFMVLLSILALIIGTIVQKKKYFRYQTEGLRGIRAYKELLLGISGILILVPYFTFFG
jgi:hypothetical protein